MVNTSNKKSSLSKSSDDKSTVKKPKVPKVRHWVFTDFDLSNYENFKLLDLAELGIRYLTYQLEKTNKDVTHLQGYIEFYKQIRMTQVKQILSAYGLHLEKRKGTRIKARDYCHKEDTPAWDKKYPEWKDHNKRIKGTKMVELGSFRTDQGQRSDLYHVADLIKDGATEYDIFDTCPTQYLKYSNGVKRAQFLIAQKRLNQYIDNLKVHVLWGPTRAKKTSRIYARYGAENCYEPTYSSSSSKWWFDGYSGQKVLVINEFYGQCRTSVLQNLLDHYRKQFEIKGGMIVSNWDTIVITSNVHPSKWYNEWEKIPQAVEDSIIERVSTITYIPKPKAKKAKKTWDSVVACQTWDTDEQLEQKWSGGVTSITPATSDPDPSEKGPLFTSGPINGEDDDDPWGLDPCELNDEASPFQTYQL